MEVGKNKLGNRLVSKFYSSDKEHREVNKVGEERGREGSLF